MKKQEADAAQRFLQLSTEALREDNPEAMIDLLEKRKTFLEGLLRSGSALSKAELQACLKAESLLHARLDAERVKLLKEMDNLSGGRKAVRKYAPDASSSTPAAFFDITT